MHRQLRRFAAWLLRPLKLTVIDDRQLQALRTDLQDRTRAQRRLDQRLAAARIKIEALKGRLAARENEVLDLGGQLLRQTLQASSEIGALKARADGLHRDGKLARRAQSRLEQRLADAGAEIEALKHLLASREDEVRDLGGRLFRQAQEAADQLGVLQARADGLHRDHKLVRRSLQRTTEALAQTRVELDAAKGDAWRLSKRLAQQDSAPSIATDRVDAWSELLVGARRQVGARALAHDGHGPAGSWPAQTPPRVRESAAPQAVRVAVVGEVRSPFLSFVDPSLVARPLGDPLVAEPDILVFPRSDIGDYRQTKSTIPESVWRRAREGRTLVAFDASREGDAHTNKRSNEIHALLRSHRIDPRNAAYITQDRLYHRDYEAWCAESGTPPMRICIFDTFIFDSLQTFRNNGPLLFEHRLARFLERPAHRSRRFLSLNFHPRPSKVLFLLRLMRDGLWDQGWISFGGFLSETEGREYTRQFQTDLLAANDGFQDDVATLTPFIDQLDAVGSILFQISDRSDAKQRKLALVADDLPQYADSWFTVVTETHFKERLHRITEKSFKAALNFHPFLVLGSPGSLGLLRQYGFETSCGMFDDRYDEEEDRRRRFDMVYDQVVRLCRMDERELARMSAGAQEVLAFNACWGLTELPRRLEETLGPALVQRLLPPARAGADAPAS